ncbi:hypothetical protein EW146_g3946 [Bondarzewia mesenterica]|uniref:Uncharacterized protein n=1 Tax=Bondarzewia mesenterica TaxID=1095465 RepID=A0A4S4LW71_9AGAM|nr:hypothetical protein EW146_g3946 [Bondarzewia mesenterica]
MLAHLAPSENRLSLETSVSRSPTPKLPGSWPGNSQVSLNDSTVVLSAAEIADLTSYTAVTYLDSDVSPDVLASAHPNESDKPSLDVELSSPSDTSDLSSSATRVASEKDVSSPPSTSSGLADATLTSGDVFSLLKPPKDVQNMKLHERKITFVEPSVETLRSEDSSSVKGNLHRYEQLEIMPYLPPSTSPSSNGPSPSFGFRSPRPMPELPSLTNSLSSADASTTYLSSVDSTLFAPLSAPSPSLVLSSPPESKMEEESPSISDSVPSQFKTAGTIATTGTSPSGSPIIILDLGEPQSPDSAHFSPTNDRIAFVSPGSSESLSHNDTSHNERHLDAALSADSAMTPSTPLLKSSSRETGTASTAVDVGECRSTVIEGERQSRHAGRMSAGGGKINALTEKRRFMKRVRTFGERIKTFLKGGNNNSRRRDSVTPSLVTPDTPSHPVSVVLPPSQSGSPTSQVTRTSTSHDADEASEPSAAVLPDTPRWSPHARTPTLPADFPGARAQTRRFSLPSLFAARQVDTNPPPVPSLPPLTFNTPTPEHTPNPSRRRSLHQLSATLPSNSLARVSSQPAQRSSVIRSESQRTVDRMMIDWAASGDSGSRLDAEEVVRGLGIDLAMRSARATGRGDTGTQSGKGVLTV